MKFYIGITIGPIHRTMSYTSTPGGLWFASYFFSTITKEICNRVTSEFNNVNIFTLRKNEEKVDEEFYNEKYQQGIGIYHDRIYFSVEEDNKANIKKKLEELLGRTIYTEVSDNSTEQGGVEEDLISYLADGINTSLENKEDTGKIKCFLEKYLEIHYVICSEKEVEKNGLSKTLADSLDALELMMKVPYEQNNYIQKLLSGEIGNNDYILQHPFIANMKKEDKGCGILVDKKRVKKLVEISSNKTINDNNENAEIKELDKLSKYYAIIQADGDNMGDLLKVGGTDNSLEDQEKRISAFSNLCTDYSNEAIKLIQNYGGVIVYAGGDDLLFLAPICIDSDAKKETNDEEIIPTNIWELCAEIGKAFDKKAKSWMEKNNINPPISPSISFGVSINYYKYPIYEAMLDAQDLLFGKAKNYGKKIKIEDKEKGIKNNIAIKVNKGSGQSQGFVAYLNSKQNNISEDNNVFEKYKELLTDIYVASRKTKEAERKDADELLHSVVYAIENKRVLFDECLKDKDNTAIVNLFKNLFEYKEVKEETNKKNKQLKAIIDLIAEIKKDKISVTGLGNDCDKKSTSYAIVEMLRVAKFLLEENVDEQI